MGYEKKQLKSGLSLLRTTGTPQRRGWSSLKSAELTSGETFTRRCEVEKQIIRKYYRIIPFVRNR